MLCNHVHVHCYSISTSLDHKLEGRKSDSLCLVTTSFCVNFMAFQELVVRNDIKQTNTENPHSGRHCCLFCEIAAGHIKVPLQARGPAPLRSLGTLQRDYLQFNSIGKGNLKNAKHFNNVIGKPFLDIPLTQVSQRQLLCLWGW